MKKFNKFNTLLETAFSHYSNGGFREGSPIKVKKAFLSSPYCQQHYGKDTMFTDWLSNMIDNDYFFFIKRVAGRSAEQNVKDANSNEGTGDVYLVLKTDPRTVSTPTELSEFTVPGNWEYVEVLNFGVNLPPVQGVPNKYDKPLGTKPEQIKIEINLGNQPKDNSLPMSNTAIPASPAVETRYA
jgi:hypothetical protein